ncbi:TorD/DmsD family molecular chaperone [Halospeciosus flavus]|uniref:Molecular chaperone n=1 Tax=Halospeciosus flavus TaxID=3032283 RepID=A0ABD5Z441_9EURY|nr:molecular chaperone TorD family protein [Halospeciosus flavus]
MDDEAIYDARTELIDYCIDVFWDAPEEEFLTNLLEGDLETPGESVNDELDTGFDYLREFVAENEGRDVSEVRDELAQEYTRVFVGPRPPVLAHETYYRDDTEFIGEGLADVEASYSGAGWKPPEDYPEENDHVAVELAFLRNLVGRQRAGQVEAFGFERVFLDEHVLQWYEPFVDDVEENTDEPLYLSAAHVFAGLVEFEDELAAQMA